MNNKIIAAGVVVALCAVALIGVGYAYTATVTDNNSLSSEFVTLKIDGNANDYADAMFSGKVHFNTTTTTSGTVWDVPIQTIESNGSKLIIEKSNAVTATKFKLSLETGTLSDSNYSSLLNGAKITFKAATGTTNADVVYLNTDGTWDYDSGSAQTFVVGEYTATLTLAAKTFSGVSVGPSDTISFTMTLTNNSTNNSDS